MHFPRLLDLLHRMLPLLLRLVHLCGETIFRVATLCRSGVNQSDDLPGAGDYCGVERQVRAVRKHELIERHLDGRSGGKVGIQNGEGELLSAGSADLEMRPSTRVPIGENEVIERVDRLHQMSLNRLAHTFHTDLAVERNLKGCPAAETKQPYVARTRWRGR